IFFFQAEDGIRDRNVTGVQTCALPIYTSNINADRTTRPQVSIQTDLRENAVILSIHHCVIQHIEPAEQIGRIVALLEKVNARGVEAKGKIDRGTQLGSDVNEGGDWDRADRDDKGNCHVEIVGGSQARQLEGKEIHGLPQEELESRGRMLKDRKRQRGLGIGIADVLHLVEEILGGAELRVRIGPGLGDVGAGARQILRANVKRTSQVEAAQTESVIGAEVGNVVGQVDDPHHGSYIVEIRQRAMVDDRGE